MNLIFVGSKQKHWAGAVYSIDIDRLRIINKYTTNRMDHPTGITSYKNILFVAEQVIGVIYSFDIHNSEFLGTVVSDSPGELEQITLSYC